MTQLLELSNFFKKQADLARLLGGGVITPSIRLKAHRIFNGVTKPNQQDIKLILEKTGGKIDANYFYGIKPKPKNKREK